MASKVCLSHGLLVRYVKLSVVLATGMPGMFSPLPLVSDPDMYHGTCVMLASLTSALLPSHWRGKRSRNLRFYVTGKRPIRTILYWCISFLIPKVHVGDSSVQSSDDNKTVINQEDLVSSELWLPQPQENRRHLESLQYTVDWEEWLQQSAQQLQRHEEQREKLQQTQENKGKLRQWLRFILQKVRNRWQRRKAASGDGKHNAYGGDREVGDGKSRHRGIFWCRNKMADMLQTIPYAYFRRLDVYFG